MAKRKKAERVGVLPDGTEFTLEEPVGRVRLVNGMPMVDEIGLALRLGLGEPVDAEHAAALYPLVELLEHEERPEPGTMVGPWPVFAWITQQEAAKAVHLTTRQVQNLEVKGLPSTGHAKSKRYPLPHLVIWFRSYRAMREPARLPFEVAAAWHRVDRARDELRAVESEHGL